MVESRDIFNFQVMFGICIFISIKRLKLKLETFLFLCSGAFKFRGACNAVFSLNDDQAAKGVITHSRFVMGSSVFFVLLSFLKNI